MVMAAQLIPVYSTENNPVKVVKLKVEEGSYFRAGQNIVELEPLEKSSHCNGHVDKSFELNEAMKGPYFIRSTSAGKVTSFYVKEGDILHYR